jgi:hypothetical protein
VPKVAKILNEILSSNTEKIDIIRMNEKNNIIPQMA